jgi:uncharacterized metal-binding protein
MQTGCGCNKDAGETLIFTCAGAAHSGQVANRAGVQLAQQKLGKLFCVAAVAAEILEKMDRTRQATLRIAIDGCDDHCCRRVMEKAGVPVDVHVVVTDLGIEKSPAQPDMIGDAKKVADRVKAAVAGHGS